MDVAVIGGGTAGLVTAWALGGSARVTVYEAEPILGGHVRTLGGNVPASGLGDLRLDAGVVLLEAGAFPNTVRLMDRVGARRRPVQAPVSLTAEPGRTVLTPEAIGWLPRRRRLPYYRRGLRILPQRLRFVSRTRDATPEQLYRTPLQDWLPGDPTGAWLRLMTMYAFSTPWPETGILPAALTVPLLRGLAYGGEWFGFVGGAWAWLQALLDDTDAEVHTDAPVERVARDDAGVELWVQGERRRFDHVVFATPPGAVLPLLADPDRGEERRWAAWRTRHVRTVVHDDPGLYDRWQIPVHTPFDMIRTGTGWGYTATLNSMSGLDRDATPTWQLAFGLDDHIAPEHVRHVQPHATPWYTVEAFRTRPEVVAYQGHRNTWVAGAWLGNGLQEGAVTSALSVAQRLGAGFARG